MNLGWYCLKILKKRQTVHFKAEIFIAGKLFFAIDIGINPF